MPKGNEFPTPSAAEDLALHPFPWYRQMRASAPVSFAPSSQAWMVFRSSEVQRVLSDYAVFSSASAPGQTSADPLEASLIALDPPRHRQLRTLVTQALPPRSVAQLSERIRSIVTTLPDQVRERGSMDLMEDLAVPLPVIVIADLLGIQEEDRARFKAWSDAVVGIEGTGGWRLRQEMSAYFLQMIKQRRANPRDDLISALLAARLEGAQLTRQELLGFCILLLVAGNETTTHLLGNALLCFDDSPLALEQVSSDRSLLPGAIEEVLRYRSPVQIMSRRALTDVTLGDQQIQAGEWLIAQIGSANRDKVHFPNADQFDIRRTPNRHLAFGHGIHFCLGAPLARLEARIALEVLLERFRAIRRIREVPLEATGSRMVFGVKHLPLTFQPRLR